MNKNNITILCSDISMNCLSRCLTLAEILSKQRQVQIVGFARGNDTIWPPAGSSNIPIIELEYGLTRRWQKAKKSLKAMSDNSILIICKPKFTSMGLALSANCNPDKCILDINDWELGLIMKSDRTDGKHDFIDLFSNLYSINSALLLRFYESRIKYFSHRIVNNRWLQQRFGGELVYDVRDTDRLDPANFDKASIRNELGLDDRPWIIFAGTSRWHKGVNNIVYALERIRGNDSPGLMLCGGGNREVIHDLVNFSRQILGKSRFCYIPEYNRLEAGKYLAAADMACIPSLQSSNAVGQVPTKLFEAMSMGLPLVTSAICDMPQLVEDIGYTVPPGDINALCAAIEKLSSNSELRTEMGNNARAKAVEKYSYHAAEPIIDSVLEKAGR